jgi:hypothetical protein
LARISNTSINDEHLGEPGQQKVNLIWFFLSLCSWEIYTLGSTTRLLRLLIVCTFYQKLWSANWPWIPLSRPVFVKLSLEGDDASSPFFPIKG